MTDDIDDTEGEYEPAGPERDPSEFDVEKDGFGRFSYDEENLLDENGEGDAEATAEAARVRERRREMTPGQRKALWHAQKRDHNRRLAEKRRKMKEDYPSRDYDESPLSKSDTVPEVDMKQSVDWLAEARDDDETDR